MGSERPYFRIQVYACPAGQEQAALWVLEEAFNAGNAFDDTGCLDFAEPYNAEDMPTGADGEIAQALIAAAPGASWVAWTDPVGTNPGQLRAYTPELGLYGPADCDAGGDVIFTLADVKAAGGRVDLYQAMGGPWKDDFDDWEARQ
jgi:hypothetical protein